jgi:hypothetical protein
MPPNARPCDDEFFLDEEPLRETGRLLMDSKTILADLLDRQAANSELTDSQHSQRKKRDRVLGDGVLIGLMAKSDYEGFKRLTTNLTIMAATAVAVGRCRVKMSSSLAEWLAFAPLYVFYGFQFQCFAFAGQHEFLHRSAFRTKWVNDVCLFLTSVFCFEMGAHEQVMHKQHHTFTNNIDKVSLFWPFLFCNGGSWWWASDSHAISPNTLLTTCNFITMSFHNRTLSSRLTTRARSWNGLVFATFP